MAILSTSVSAKESSSTGRIKPAAQPTLRVGPIDDPLEREADRVADAVLAGRSVGAITNTVADVPQRKCAQCEEEDKTLQRKPTGASTLPKHGASAAAASVAHGGAGLSPQQRAYFEPRFGRDFSNVRLHLGGSAAAAAADINAHAFTLGNDIAFASGAYRPDSKAGRQLLAHELAHVAQQQGAAPAIIRRASYGAAPPPNWGKTPIAPVPEDERADVDQAMALIDDLVSKPESFAECHDQFAQLCPGGSRSTLASVWRKARIWRLTSPDPDANARGDVNGSDIAYTKTGLDQGIEGLAGSLLHEAGHNCGIPGGATHWHAAKIRTYCIGPGRNAISFGLGVDLGGEAPSLVLSYRRFLGDLASGRLKFTLGADLNLVGGLLGVVPSVDKQNTIPRFPAEFGSVMAGAQARLGGWGGSRFGGLSLRFETGFGAGQFALRQVANEDPKSAIAPAWILQVGPRAEFLVKSGDAHVTSFSISAALRHVQPINGEARALTAIVGSVEFPF